MSNNPNISTSGSPPPLRQPEANPETWITASEAASIQHLSLRTVLNRAASGKLPSKIPDDIPFTYDDFTLREKPILVNELWQGDHHVFDLFVRVTVKRQSGGRILEKEIAVRPTLTAWMDTATGCVVGWVISILPNADTIAEAFCRAAALIQGEIFRGLTKAILVDCGKDYRSALLEDLPNEISADSEDTMYLNKRFAGLGLLRALSVEVHHALPYHPQSKSIERTFGTLEREWICKLKGWCHNSVKERPDGFPNTCSSSWKSPWPLPPLPSQ